MVVFPDGASARCAELRIERLTEALGAPPVTEPFDDDLLCEWSLGGFLVSATVKSSGRVCELGFSRISLADSSPENDLPS